MTNTEAKLINLADKATAAIKKYPKDTDHIVAELVDDTVRVVREHYSINFQANEVHSQVRVDLNQRKAMGGK